VSQLSLFSESESSEIIIPKDVISPLESSKGPKTKAFKKEQQQWAKYVKAVQDYHDCSWFDARKLVISHRDKQEPIKAMAME
jgi:hypothetical protein